MKINSPKRECRVSFKSFPTTSRFFTTILVLALFVTSCNKDEDVVDPSVCFEYSTGDLYAEMGVSFTAACSQKTFQTYTWDFGDGDIGSGLEVTHTYDAAGKYKVVLTAMDGLVVKATEKTINVLPSPFIKHCADVTGAETWEEGMHMVTCDIDVNGTLTIKPGALIYMASEKSITVNGKLLAQGTAAKPIKFLPGNNGTTPGQWGHIMFTSTASNESILDYCEIKFGGKAWSYWYPGFEYYSSYGTVHVKDCEISINNSSIEGGAAYGIVLTENAKFKSFANNKITASTKNPIRIYGTALHTIGKTSTYPSEKEIVVVGSEYLNPGADVTWYKQTVPYLLDGSVGLYGGFTVTIEAGTTIELDSKNFFNVGYISSGTGTLKAIGTASQPIIFTSARATKARGDWAGVLIGSNSVLQYCVIEYAGSDYTISGYNRAVAVSGTATVDNCTIQESSETGLAIGGTTATIRNNTIKNCTAAGIAVDIQGQHVVEDSNTITGTDGFHVSGGSGMNTNITLKKRPYPYVLTGLSIYAGATLTLDPGVEIQMRSGASISMGWDNISNSYSGNIKANGTSADPIKFSLYAKDKSAGLKNWGALFFAETSTTSVLNNCILTDGGYPLDGNQNTFTDTGIINCYKTVGFPTITNCTISNSSTYGIALKSGATITSSNITFSNNTSGNILTN